VLTSTVLAIVVEAIVKVGPSKGVDPKGWNWAIRLCRTRWSACRTFR
jgi:hypothetical protein